MAKLYMNNEYGHLLTWEEMQREFREEYDGEDPTNPVRWYDLYTPVN